MAQSTRPTPYDEPMLEPFDDNASGFDDRTPNDFEFKAYDTAPLMVRDRYQHPEEMPIFLASDEEEPEHRFGSGRFGSGGARNLSRALVWSRILKGGIAAAFAAGIALAIMSMENPLSVFANAKASLGSEAPAQFGAAQPEAAQPPQRIVAQPVNPEPPAALDAATTRRIQAAALSGSPTRDEITAAYQSAIKGKVVVPEPVAREAPVAREILAPPARRIDPDELAMLLKRAKGLLAIGDIAAARLLLERAADAQEVEAALMLAGTYDPQVLGTQDMRSVTPDPAAARLWYQKAAQLGSADAKRRLGQNQN